jgi:hypothetical protein
VVVAGVVNNIQQERNIKISTFITILSKFIEINKIKILCFKSGGENEPQLYHINTFSSFEYLYTL